MPSAFWQKLASIKKDNKLSEFISIIVPTFNHANFLKRAIRSVIEQTHSEWEMIVIDNHSKDETDQVIQGFKDARITLLKIENQGIIAASRNKGLRLAKGGWIAFLDSDDLWSPNRLEVFCACIKKYNDIDVWSSNENYVDRAKKIVQPLKYGPFKKPFYKHLLLTGNCLSPSATIVRRQFMIDKDIFFRETREFITAEDFDLWLLLAQASAKFKFIDQILGEFTIHENNNSKSLDMHKINTLNVIKDHVFNIQEFNDNKTKLWESILSRRQFVDGLIFLRDGEWRVGIIKVIKSINASPLSCAQEVFWLMQKYFFKMSFK